MALVSWVAPGSGSEAHRRRPAGLTSTCRLRPVRLCLPDHRSVRSFQLQHGRSVPSMMCTPPWGTSSTVASTGPKTLAMIRVTTEIAREIVGCDTPHDLGDRLLGGVGAQIHQRRPHRGQWAKNSWRQGDLSITQYHFHQAAQLRSVQACDALTHDGSFLRGFM